MDFNPKGFTAEGTYSPDLLIAGDHPIRTIGVTIISGQNLSRGALLGQITASGKFNLSDDGAVDGSEVPEAILGEDVDASAGDQVSFAYVSGDFNENEMTFGGAHTADSVREALRAKSIYLHKAVAA